MPGSIEANRAYGVKYWEQHKSCSLRVSSAAMRIARKACLGEAKRRREAGEKLVTNATGTAGGPGH